MEGKPVQYHINGKLRHNSRRFIERSWNHSGLVPSLLPHKHPSLSPNQRTPSTKSRSPKPRKSQRGNIRKLLFSRCRYRSTNRSMIVHITKHKLFFWQSIVHHQFQRPIFPPNSHFLLVLTNSPHQIIQ